MMTATPNIEKLNQLRKSMRECKDTSESYSAHIQFCSDEIIRLQAFLPGATVNEDELVSIEKEIRKVKEKRAEFQRQFSQVNDDLKAIIELLNRCEAWLERQGIPIPRDAQSGSSFSYYVR